MASVFSTAGKVDNRLVLITMRPHVNSKMVIIDIHTDPVITFNINQHKLEQLLQKFKEK